MSRLREACGEGRLALDELLTRTHAAQQAGTEEELRRAVADLPRPIGASPGRRPRRARRIMGGFLSLAHRWPAVRLRPRTLAVALASDVVIDLRQAAPTAWSTVIDAVAVGSEIRIVVPPGMRVYADGTAAVLGWTKVPRTPPEPAGELFAPELHVHAAALLGNVRIEIRGLGD